MSTVTTRKLSPAQFRAAIIPQVIQPYHVIDCTDGGARFLQGFDSLIRARLFAMLRSRGTDASPTGVAIAIEPGIAPGESYSASTTEAWASGKMWFTRFDANGAVTDKLKVA